MKTKRNAKAANIRVLQNALALCDQNWAMATKKALMTLNTRIEAAKNTGDRAAQRAAEAQLEGAPRRPPPL